MLNWIKSLTKKVPRKKKGGPAKGYAKKGRTKQRAQKAPAAKRIDRDGSRGSALVLSRGEHGISRKNIDEHAIKVLYRLQNGGFHAQLVGGARSEEHTSELQSRPHLVCRLLLEKKK